MQTSALALLVGLSVAPAAYAQEAVSRFAIPAQPLSSGLLVLGRQAHISIAAPVPLVSGVAGRPVQGELTVRAALARILEGTGLSYEFVGPSAVRIRGESDAPQHGAGEPPGSAEVSLLSEVLVVGTRIRGQAPVGSSVVSMDRDDIEQIGRPTIAELMRAIPQVQTLGTTEGTRGSRGQGEIENHGAGSGVNLRGLGVDATLTLVNGRRVAPSAAGAFVDITQIPIAAVERVEVLPDGASALYGSDAIGGVVNFVLRKNFDGAETSFRYGGASGFHDYSASQLLGKAWPTGSVSFAYEYYSRTHLAGFKRDYYRSDLRGLGGMNFQSQVVRHEQAFTGNPGTIVADGKAYALPLGRDGKGLKFSDLIAGAHPAIDPQLYQDIIPSQERHNTALSIVQELGARVELFGDVLYSRRDFERKTQPANRELYVPRSNPFFIPGIPGSPDVNVVRYSFARDYDASTKGQSENFTVTGGAAVKLPYDWRGDIHASVGRDDLEAVTRGFPNQSRMLAALADGNPATAFNPYGDGSFTPRETLAKIEGSGQLRQTFDIRSVAASAGGSLFMLPAGEVRAAVGVDYREETLKVSQVFDDVEPTPQVGGPLDGAGRFERSIRAAYFEILTPLFGDANALPGLRKLDLSVAARFERYSDFGDTTNPKVGLRWSPFEDLMVRGSWSTSFKAPRLVQLNEARNVYKFAIAPNPGARPDAPSTPAPGYSYVIALLGLGNKSLKPETAESWSFGADFEPKRLPGFKASATYFSVKYDDRILGATEQDVIAALASGVVGDLVPVINPSQAQLDKIYTSGAYAPGDPLVPAAGVYAVLSLQASNYGAVKMDGLDVSASYDFDTSLGRFGLSAGVTHILSYEVQRLRSDPFLDVLNTTSNPNDLRARLAANWSSGAWRLGFAIDHVGGYTNTFSNEKVSAWTTADLQAGYTFDEARAGLSGVSLSLDVENLFDKDPPFVNNGTGGANIGYDPEFASPRGRVISLTVRKRW